MLSLLCSNNGVDGLEDLDVDLMVVMLVSVLTWVDDGEVVLQTAVRVAAVDVVDVRVAPLDEHLLVFIRPASNEDKAVPRLFVGWTVGNRVSGIGFRPDLVP